MYLTADFETTTDENDCRVWAWGLCNIYDTSSFTFGNSIDTFFDEMKKQNNQIYFHNLKFDGEFIFVWLFEHGYELVKNRKLLDTKKFCTLISDKGQFYSIEICFERIGKKSKHLTIYDSLKILPFKVSQIAKGFGLTISKLEINYNEKREIGHILTAQEKEYLKNDVRIVAMVLQTLFSQNLKKMTQGSNALSSYKLIVGKKNFERWFPSPDCDEAIRKSYKGGFTYLSPKFRNKIIENGIVLDVNSLYPSVMYYQPLPYGDGIYFDGEYAHDEMYPLYIQKLKCQFELKPNKIPTIQLKNNLSFNETEYLKSSDGKEVTLTLTNVDLKLFFDHYNVYNTEYINGWKWKSITGLFKQYIDKWTTVKIESKKDGNKCMYKLAKLMLNALYGKFSTNPNVQSKYPVYDNGKIRYVLGDKETRKPVYIPVGTFITSWARYKTITSAQSVYKRFIYADTDSLHLIGSEIPKNLEIDDYKLGAWKHESSFSKAKFLRQKSYMEYGGEPNKPETWEWNITCAGMPDECKDKVTFDNFTYGSEFDGKLRPVHVPGGIVLKDTEFTIKE